MQNIIAIVIAVLGSGAVFGFLQYLIARYDNKEDIVSRVVALEESSGKNKEAIELLKDGSKVSLGNSIFKTCTDYLDRGDYITHSELQNLESMYEVYSALNGNSYAADIMQQVRELRIRSK